MSQKRNADDENGKNVISLFIKMFSKKLLFKTFLHLDPFCFLFSSTFCDIDTLKFLYDQPLQTAFHQHCRCYDELVKLNFRSVNFQPVYFKCFLSICDLYIIDIKIFA
jgi:hypothetical protein